MLSWNNSSKHNAKFEVSTDPNFRRVLITKKAKQGAKVSGLKNKYPLLLACEPPSR
ncbi:hypothetical protein [Rubritalea tangerina]|uniref:hypothetical protein n=1 Tax=Rubritalea tangerina TaxID=430798 RepID=UPI003617B60C